MHPLHFPFLIMASEEEYAASWVVLYCPSDDSHVLVCDAAVLYDDRLLEEDEVKFDYPGSKKLLTGVVKGFSSKFSLTQVRKIYVFR